MSSEIDVMRLANQIRAKRGGRGLRAVAEEIGGISASTLSRIEQGKVPDLDTFIRLCRWLGVSADMFSIANPETEGQSEPSTPQVITAHLRADRTLDSQTTEALIRMIEMAFNGIDQGRIAKRKGKNASRIQGSG